MQHRKNRNDIPDDGFGRVGPGAFLR